MLPALTNLGLLPRTAGTAWWLASKLGQKATHWFDNPADMPSRVGDVFVWDGKVIAFLEDVFVFPKRIMNAAEGIEAAALTASGALITLTHLSMMSLGLRSLTAATHLWRVQALDKRLAAISQQIAGLGAQLTAVQLAHLQNCLHLLEKFEQAPTGANLQVADQAINFAMNLFRNLVELEVKGEKRLPVLNQWGRYYLLALTAMIRLQILKEDMPLALTMIAKEKVTLEALARVTFGEVLGQSPETYLHPNFQDDHVTLDLLTEIYQQARHAGAVTGDACRDAGSTFEYLRGRIYKARGWRVFSPVRKAKADLLVRLKHLMACLEDVNRIEALRLRIADAIAGNYSLYELEQQLNQDLASIKEPLSAGPEEETGIMAFTLN